MSRQFERLEKVTPLLKTQCFKDYLFEKGKR